MEDERAFDATAVERDITAPDCNRKIGLQCCDKRRLYSSWTGLNSVEGSGRTLEHATTPYLLNPEQSCAKLREVVTTFRDNPRQTTRYRAQSSHCLATICRKLRMGRDSNPGFR